MEFRKLSKPIETDMKYSSWVRDGMGQWTEEIDIDCGEMFRIWDVEKHKIVEQGDFFYVDTLNRLHREGTHGKKAVSTSIAKKLLSGRYCYVEAQWELGVRKSISYDLKITYREGKIWY